MLTEKARHVYLLPNLSVFAVFRCAKNGYTSRWYHLSCGEHFCNECFDHYYRRFVLMIVGSFEGGREQREAGTQRATVVEVRRWGVQGSQQRHLQPPGHGSNLCLSAEGRIKRMCYVYNGILCSHKEEHNCAICRDVERRRDCPAE